MSLVDKQQFLTIWYKECMERGTLVLQKIKNHEYIMDDPKEKKDFSNSSDVIIITVEERIEMFKYFMEKYDYFDRSSMLNYLFMVEFLTILHPKEFNFLALHESLNSGVDLENGDADILKELLLYIKKFFKRRNLKPTTGYLK